VQKEFLEERIDNISTNMKENDGSLFLVYVSILKKKILQTIQKIYIFLIGPFNPHSNYESFWEFFYPQRFLLGIFLILIVENIANILIWNAVYNLTNAIATVIALDFCYYYIQDFAQLVLTCVCLTLNFFQMP